MDVDKLKAQLEVLRQNFIDQLPQRLETLETGLSVWKRTADEAELTEFHRAAHSLTGAGATFGCAELSRVARLLEKQLVSVELARDFDAVEQLFDDVRQAVQAVADDDFVEPELSQALSPGNSNRVVYILEDDEASRRQMTLQLQSFGYSIDVFETPSALAAGVEQQRPAIIVADIVMAEGALAGIDVIKSINAKQKEPIPVVFISAHDDFKARLEAVRAGGLGYFKKPLMIESLVDMVDQVLIVKKRSSYKVMIVDDSEPQAEFYANVLVQAGVEVEVVSDVERVLDAIQEHSPELVLMDMYMPLCNGIELAAVIRQQPDYLGLPIVFLSSETDRRVQLEALSKGGDDFLTKPISSEDLIDSVSIRAERYRNLRSRMSEDSLTGLLNHRRIMESLQNEVARVTRHGGQLAYAMLDIDNFKSINDSYGHAVGDRVIKSLSRLLKQRLRSTDIVGRYGGEEFAVIMPETSMQAAEEVMEEVRQDFSELTHFVGDKSVHVALSGGVAVMPPVVSAGELRELADQMLYKAKQNGRNQIAIAPAS